MQKEFTKDFMIENKGCYDLEQLMKCSFMNSGKITLKSILESEISIKDKYWFCCKKLFTIRQNQEISIIVAEAVLEIYEKQYPGNDAPRKAIQAAKDYLNGVGTANAAANAANAAADAANAAADAANAAANAAYAAYAAADAANAAADAAYAAYAAYAAAYAADGKKIKFEDLLLIILIDFCENN